MRKRESTWHFLKFALLRLSVDQETYRKLVSLAAKVASDEEWEDRDMRVQRVLAVAVVSLFLISLGFGQMQGRTERFVYPLEVEGQNLGSCGTFDLLADYVVMVSGVVVYDKQGQWIKEVDKVKLIGQTVYYNSTNPDLFLLGGPGEHEVDHYDAESGTVAGTGVIWKIKVPGYGWIFMETGRFVFDFNTGELLFNTGHNQFLDGDIAAVCNALTP